MDPRFKSMVRAQVCCTVNRGSLSEGIMVPHQLSHPPPPHTHTHQTHTAQSPGLLQPVMCVLGNSCPRGRATAEDEGGIRRDSCRHSITTDDRTAQLNQHRAFPSPRPHLLSITHKLRSTPQTKYSFSHIQKVYVFIIITHVTVLYLSTQLFD